MRPTLFLITLALSASVFAQDAIQTPLEVQRLAPQLVAFAGGDANFQNLVNGLASGSMVTLSTPLSIGGMQTATFTPTGTMSAHQIAQTLESVRQSLIARGIATPSAQQLAVAMAGGPLAAPAGPTQVTGVVATTTTASTTQQSPAVQIQNTFGQGAAGASTSIRSQTSDSPFPRGISDTPQNAGLIPQTPSPTVAPQSTAAQEPTRVTPQSTAPLTTTRGRDR